MTTRTTRSTRSLLMLELLSRSFCWYKQTSIEWFSLPILSLITRCSSIRGFSASCRLDCDELCLSREYFSAKFWMVPPHPALLVSLSWDRCFLFSISLLLFCLRLMLDTRSCGGWNNIFVKYFLAATEALEVQMLVHVSVCHTCYNCTKALNFRVFRLKDFWRTFEGLIHRTYEGFKKNFGV